MGLRKINHLSISAPNLLFTRRFIYIPENARRCESDEPMLAVSTACIRILSITFEAVSWQPRYDNKKFEKCDNLIRYIPDSGKPFSTTLVHSPYDDNNNASDPPLQSSHVHIRN